MRWRRRISVPVPLPEPVTELPKMVRQVLLASLVLGPELSCMPFIFGFTVPGLEIVFPVTTNVALATWAPSSPTSSCRAPVALGLY